MNAFSKKNGFVANARTTLRIILFVKKFGLSVYGMSLDFNTVKSWKSIF